MRLGRYATTGERMHRLGFVSVYAVQDGPRRLLAKVIESDGLPAEEMIAHAGEDLHASASLLRHAERVPGVARVVDLGTSGGAEAGAYVIYERYADNARALLGARERPPAGEVLAAVERLRSALAGFAESTGRPHGHATLTNILLGGPASGSSAGGDSAGVGLAEGLGLTDPLPAIADEARAARADRAAVGAFLLALVTGRDAGSLRGVEVPADRDWSVVFGSQGAAPARRLCHALLFDGGASLPMAEELGSALRFREGLVNRKSVAAMVAAAVLVIASGIGWLLTRPPAPPTADREQAALALARHPAQFRRVFARDPGSVEYQRLSAFGGLLAADPWAEGLARTPPSGEGTVRPVYEAVWQAVARAGSPQINFREAQERLHAALESTPDEAPLEVWDEVARTLLAPGQDEKKLDAQRMFGAIVAMSERFDAAGVAAGSFVAGQRARLASVRSSIESSIGGEAAGSFASLVALDERLDGLEERLFELFAARTPAARVAAAGAGAGAPGQGVASEALPEGDVPSADERVASDPGLGGLDGDGVTALFDRAWSFEAVSLALESELARAGGDARGAGQTVRALSEAALADQAVAAFRDDSVEPQRVIGASLARALDAALLLDIERLLEERDASGRWSVGARAEFVGVRGVRERGDALVERLRGVGVLSELAWVWGDAGEWSGASDGEPREGALSWTPDRWAALLGTDRFVADRSAYAIDALAAALEGADRDLAEADETSDPRYAALRAESSAVVRRPELDRAFAHWPTPERHAVVARGYERLTGEVVAAVKVLDPCYPLKAGYIERALAALEAGYAGPIEGVPEEVAALVRRAIGGASARDEVRADRSARPDHPRDKCANADLLEANARALVSRLRGELAGASIVPASGSNAAGGDMGAAAVAGEAPRDRAWAAYVASVRGAWFDGEGWSDGLGRRLFAAAGESVEPDWPAPGEVEAAVARLAELQARLDDLVNVWRWIDIDDFFAMRDTFRALEEARRGFESGPRPIAVGAAYVGGAEDPWTGVELLAARMLRYEAWLCGTDSPEEREVIQVLISAERPDHVVPASLDGDTLSSKEIVFIYTMQTRKCPPEVPTVPETPESFIEYGSVARTMRRALEQDAPRDRNPLIEDLSAQFARLWRVVAASYASDRLTPGDWAALAGLGSGDASEFRGAFTDFGLPMAEEAGGPASPWRVGGEPGLSARARANWAVWNAVVRLSALEVDDEASARSIIDALVRDAQAVRSADGGAIAGDSSLDDRLRTLSRLPEDLSARPPDFGTPGALPGGWRASSSDNFQTIEVTIPGLGARSFIGVRAAGGRGGYPSAYIAREELAIGDVNALLEAVPSAEAREALLARLREADEANRGAASPVGWVLRDRAVVPADPILREEEVAGQLDRSFSSGGWFSLVPLRGGQFAALAQRDPELPYTSRPTPMTPLQMVPASIVIDLLSSASAGRLRVPSREEWSAVAGSFSGEDAALNLRDRAYREALSGEVRRFQNNPADPARFVSTFRIIRQGADRWSRVPAGQPNADADRRRGFVNDRTNDGFALFAPTDRGGVASSGGGRLAHAFGNVAEVVAAGGAHAVVGGSALSTAADFGERFDEPIPLDAAGMDRPFSDVGFRIAIDPPPSQPYVLVALDRLARIGFLPPADR